MRRGAWTSRRNRPGCRRCESCTCWTPGRRSGSTLEGWAVPEGLADLHDLVERARVAHPDVDETAFVMLETAAIEIAGNVVEHGLPPGQVWWSFTLRMRPDHVEGVLADDGQRYEGDLSALMPDPLAESGRGIALAQAALDELHYAHEGDKNVWTMRRRLRD